jgi:predicted metalloprotease with PDZ domain
MITATFVRESPEVKLGISLQRINDRLVITKLTPYGVVATQTDLCVGHRILMINNADCTDMNAETAIVILKTTLGLVTILADNSEVPIETEVIAKAEPVPEGFVAVSAVSTASAASPPHPPGKPAGGTW